MLGRKDLPMPAPAQRLHDLRAELARRGLEGFLVPRADEHQGEYVPPRAQRLGWLTGFAGSAGQAAVLSDKAAIFVDGRYTLQVGEQVDTDLFTPRHSADEPLTDWLQEVFPAGGKLGYDPWLHTEDQVAALAKKLTELGGELVPTEDNPLDAVWRYQPPPPTAPIAPHPLDYAGLASLEKRQALAAELRSKDLTAAVLTLPDSIAWLLNVRGGDVDCTPLPLSFATLKADGAVDWFVAPQKLGDNVRAQLDEAIQVAAPGDFGPSLDQLKGAKVLVDGASAPAWVFQRLRAAGATLVKGGDPCQLPKAIKNAAELAGTRAAHRRDGLALTRFLAWLDREAASRASGEAVMESEAAAQLEAFRKEDPLYRQPSFETISGSGPNGAIVHYRFDAESDRALGLGELFLCDSGGQYLDGTTDVTRTVAIGEPSAGMRRAFTLVLKGHIALARARFPVKTTGSQLDSLARYPLWLDGLDYDHGTGHGVGSYLGVHEGPQRISKVFQKVPLEPGMIVSNEPGYYKTGAFGIRIENLVVVIESPAAEGADEDRPMRAFETLTLAPIDRRLIDPARLTGEETAWLDGYHRRVWETHEDKLDPPDRTWLEAATQPIGQTAPT